MEDDPQLAALMVANAKKQALENTRAHYFKNNNNRNHQKSESSTDTDTDGQGLMPIELRQRKSNPNTPHLALQQAAVNMQQQEQRQSQNITSSLDSSTLWRFDQQQQQQQQQQDRAEAAAAISSDHHHDYPLEKTSRGVVVAASDVSPHNVYGGSDYSHFSSGMETTKASNVANNNNNRNHHPYSYGSGSASGPSSDVSSSFFHSDFSIPDAGAESDILIRDYSQDYYASPNNNHHHHLIHPERNLMDSSTSDFDDSSTSTSAASSTSASIGNNYYPSAQQTNMYPASPLNQFGAVSSSPSQQQQKSLKMVPMSANLVLPTIASLEDSSEDGIFVDRSPAESPIPILRDEPSQLFNMVMMGSSSSSPSRLLNNNTTGFTVTPTKYGSSPPTTPTNNNNNKTPKMSNTTTSSIRTTEEHDFSSSQTTPDKSNIVYQDSSDDDDEKKFDSDDILLIDPKTKFNNINKNDVTLSSEPLNDLSRFEDEPSTQEDDDDDFYPIIIPEEQTYSWEKEFPICAAFSNWTRRNRTLLCLLISIFLVTTILIVIRNRDNMAIQDNTPPNLADTIKINRTDDDDDFQIVIVNNTQQWDDDGNNNNNQGPATISTTPEPTTTMMIRPPPSPSPGSSPPTTRRPTPALLPTKTVSRPPTKGPTPPPTRFPTPRPTRYPTPYPTFDPFSFNREQFLFQVVSKVSSASSLLDDTTPQYRAFQFLVKEDTNFAIQDPLKSLGKGNDLGYHEMVLDRYVMAVLYFATNGPNWRLDYNFLSKQSICDWNDGGAGAATEGVTCRLDHGGGKGYEIQEIVLDVNFLDGMIPREIGQFSSLQKLTMGSNNLFGIIPTELGTLEELTYLGLQRNYFVGSVPAQIGRLTKLTGLILHDTGLNGRIPSTFRQLSNLSLLFLEATALTGDLDYSFCNDNQIYQMFFANCRGSSAFVKCSCCTHCCLEQGGGCQRQATSRSDNDGVLN